MYKKFVVLRTLVNNGLHYHPAYLITLYDKLAVHCDIHWCSVITSCITMSTMMHSTMTYSVCVCVCVCVTHRQLWMLYNSNSLLLLCYVHSCSHSVYYVYIYIFINSNYVTYHDIVYTCLRGMRDIINV